MSRTNEGVLNQEAEEKPTKQRFLVVAMLFVGIMVAYLDRVNVSILGANTEFLEFMGIKGQPVQIGLMMSPVPRCLWCCRGDVESSWGLLRSAQIYGDLHCYLVDIADCRWWPQ